MKVIIDLIEDIRTAIHNDTRFSLAAMQLTENPEGEFIPAGESNICRYSIDDQHKKLYCFLGQEPALTVGPLLETLNALANEAMMYEVCISYAKGEQRIDQPLIGFGESLQDKRYLLFISDK